MTVATSLLLFALAAFAKIGGACLVWQGSSSARWCASGLAVIMYAQRPV